MFLFNVLIDVEEKAIFLFNYLWFKRWTNRELKALSWCYEERIFVFNTTLFSRGDTSRDLYFIYEGSVELTQLVNQNGQSDHPYLKENLTYDKHSLCILGAGEVFGEDAFILQNGKINFDIRKSTIQGSGKALQTTPIWCWKRRYEAVCKSRCVVFVISAQNIENELTDTYTRRKFK